jgi:hypothetical protein
MKTHEDSISIRLRGNFAENFWAQEGKRRKEETRDERKGEQALSRGGAWCAHG